MNIVLSFIIIVAVIFIFYYFSTYTHHKYKTLILYGILFLLTLIVLLPLMQCKKCKSNLRIESYKDLLVSCSSENYLGDSSFKDGKDLSQLTSPDPHFQIVTYNNPGDSSYCLLQSETDKTSGKNAYQLNFNVVPGHKYVFQIWNTYDFEWNTEVKPFTVSYENTQTNEIQPIYAITKTVQLGNSTCQSWNLLEAVVDIPINANNGVSWKIGYPANKTKGNAYWTKPLVKRFRPALNDFPITQGLQSFVASYHPYSYTQSDTLSNTTWKDLSGEGHDYYWETMPEFDSRNGFTINNNVLYGNYCSGLGLGTGTNSPFTIAFVYKTKSNKDKNYYKFLNLYGLPVDTNTSNLSIDLLSVSFNNQNIQLSHNNKIATFSCGLTTVQSCYFILNDGKGKLHLYRDNVLVGTTDNAWLTPYNWSSDKRITVNSNKNSEGQLASILTYNTVLCSQDIEIVKTYLLQHLNHLDTPKMENISCENATMPINHQNQKQALQLQLQQKMQALKMDMQLKMDPLYERLVELKTGMVDGEEDMNEIINLEAQKEKLLAKYQSTIAQIEKQLAMLDQMDDTPPPATTSTTNTIPEVITSEDHPDNIPPAKCSVCYSNGTRFNYEVYPDDRIVPIGQGYMKEYDYDCPAPLSRYGQNAFNCRHSGGGDGNYPPRPVYPPYYRETDVDVDVDVYNINVIRQQGGMPANEYEAYNEMSVRDLANHLDNGPFVRSTHVKPKKTCYNQDPDPGKWVRKDSIPCWGCSIDEADKNKTK